MDFCENIMGEKLLICSKTNCATDKQFSSNTSGNITVLQHMIIGNAVRLTTVLVNLMAVKVATTTIAVKLKTQRRTGNMPARAAAQGVQFSGSVSRCHTHSSWRGAVRVYCTF